MHPQNQAPRTSPAPSQSQKTTEEPLESMLSLPAQAHRQKASSQQCLLGTQMSLQCHEGVDHSIPSCAFSDGTSSEPKCLLEAM